MQRVTKYQGFTLIELMVVVTIVGILAVVAYPSYMDSITKGRRADAKSVLVQAAQWMERSYTTSNTYPADLSGSNLTISPIGAVGANVYYNISKTPTTAGTTFTLSAVPTTNQTDLLCQTLTLTNTGLKGVTGTTAPTQTADYCWR